jgi:hypothetical protein
VLIEILHVTDCPSVQPLIAELEDIVGARGDVTITVRLVRTTEEAAELGFQGSPTILFNGRDLFSTGQSEGALSCRLFTTADGLRGWPSKSQLTGAIESAGSATNS